MTSKTGLKRIPPGSVRLRFAGELVVPQCTEKSFAGLFRRYEALFELFANMEKPERLLNYHLITALVLTSYAKKAEDGEQKKNLFNLKNNLYLAVANDRDLRRSVAFKYLKSKNFLVTKYCDECEKRNAEAKLERHDWKYCKNCKVDRDFYNVLSMHHRFDKGYLTVFLSNDLVPQIKGLKIKKKGKIGDHKEEGRFDKFQYNIRNLDAVSLDDALALYHRLVKAPPT